ncbi:MAG: nucleotidyltransferase domain-containing protein [Anaerolineae bacterium]
MNTTLLKQIIAEQPYPLLFMTVSGAHLYGFPSPDSDYDLRGAHLLPLREVLGLLPSNETVKFEEIRDGVEIDLETHDVLKYFHLLMQKSGNMLEQIYSPLVLATHPLHDELKQVTRHYITRHHVHHYLGFSKSQWELFDKERPRRVKPLLYTFRVLLSGIHLMRTGEVEANLVHLNEIYKLAYVPELIARKLAGGEQGTLTDSDVTFYQREYERLRAELEAAHAESTLPDAAPGREALHELLLKIRLGA